MDKKTEVIEEIRRVAGEISPDRLTKRAFGRLSRVSEGALRYHFGSFNAAVEAAGLKPNPPCISVSARSFLEAGTGLGPSRGYTPEAMV